MILFFQTNVKAYQQDAQSCLKSHSPAKKDGPKPYGLGPGE